LDWKVRLYLLFSVVLIWFLYVTLYTETTRRMGDFFWGAWVWQGGWWFVLLLIVFVLLSIWVFHKVYKNE
jgi:hypothetical protein